MDLTGFSFLENDEDFDIGKSIEDDYSFQSEKNIVKIEIWNKNMYLGESVRGIVKIYIPNKIEKGQVMLNFEASIVSKVRSKVNPVNLKSIIHNYK